MTQAEIGLIGLAVMADAQAGWRTVVAKTAQLRHPGPGHLGRPDLL